MAWKVEFSEGAKKALKALDPPIARRILRFVRERLETDEDPRRLGDSLEGSRLGEFWKYRLGDWRMVCHIQDSKVIILVLKLGHRSGVYLDK